MFLVLLASAAAAATAVNSDARHVSLTIYNEDLALVQEQRTLNLVAGRNRLELKDVSAAIQPDTVSLSAPGVSLVEQNFDYDLISPAKLMEKAVGQQVQIVRTNPGNGQQVTETATVLSVNSGVVLRIGDRIEVLRDDGTPTRVIFPKVPEGLRPQPTLSMTVDADAAGPRTAVLSYLTTGLFWKANYVALFDEAGGRLDLQGWITLKNATGTSFNDVDAQLVAGDINLRHGQRDDEWRYHPQAVAPSNSAGYERTTAGWADYYLYPLGHRTTIADKQTKQVSFLDTTGVLARKAYQARVTDFESRDMPQHVGVVVRFSNSKAGGLAAALPGGIVRVYMRDPHGEAKFVGEDAIEHTPQGSEVSVKTGESFDVSLLATALNAKAAGKVRTTYDMSYRLTNARPEPVVVEVSQSGLQRSGRILKETQTSRRLNAQTVAWDVAVPANGETTLTATISTGG